MKSLPGLMVLILACAAIAPAQDPGWPRIRTKGGAQLITYQPQVELWSNARDLHFRLAFALTPPDGKEVVGVVTMHARTIVDAEDDAVVITDIII